MRRAYRQTRRPCAQFDGLGHPPAVITCRQRHRTNASQQRPEEVVMNPICRSSLIRRAAAVLTGLAAPLAPITTGSAVLASPFRADPPGWFQRLPVPAHLPPLPPGWYKHPPLPGPAPVHTAPAGGIAGWQITLIAAGATVLTTVLAVIAARRRAARRNATTTSTQAMTASGATWELLEFRPTLFVPQRRGRTHTSQATRWPQPRPARTGTKERQ
jgi:hypothetical protein